MIKHDQKIHPYDVPHISEQYGLKMNIVFRKATFEDAELLFNWRNEKHDRLNSYNSDLIKFDAHCQWLNNLITDSNREQLIALLDGIPVGTLRIDSRHNPAELAWSIDSNKRNKGIGKIMLKTFFEYRHGIYRAEIKSNNIASRKIAEYTGMSLIKIKNNICYYIYNNTLNS
ncbi:MAG: GNAT family N-acetyltransferase [Verrucomicrobiae bacterium]|nr:GNAT family N-acetyltransferase [Verrucomicrobiae bacterium]